jgi:hypothetical protein
MRKFLTIVILLLLVGVGVGFGMGWLRVESVTNPSGNKSLSVTLDKEKVKADARALTQATENAAEKIGQAVKDSVVTKSKRVTLTEIVPAEKFIKGYAPRLEDISFEVTAETRIRRGDRDILLEVLKPGETVDVTYVQHDSHNVARSITTVD